MTEPIRYRTISTPCEGFYKEKGSKFLCFCFPINNEEEIKEHLDLFKKTYYDARHVCYAYILGYKKDKYRAYDDGEPNHSAGDPILNQLRSFELSDVLAIVIRYFGGTKLGVSGLITAYKTATSNALSQAHIIEKIPTELISHSFSYDEMNKIMSVVKYFDLEIENQQFEIRCNITLKVPLHLLVQVQSQLNN